MCIGTRQRDPFILPVTLSKANKMQGIGKRGVQFSERTMKMNTWETQRARAAAPCHRLRTSAAAAPPATANIISLRSPKIMTE